ncbi:MAG TPA: Smr/MutS family protein [Beijerinckiaceae bacterium]|nr:Smr/MutS family protein [Beijerinckiaceae bacterium]
MTWSRRPRRLTPEERRLWAHVARGVTPLDGRSLPAEPAPPASGPEQPPGAGQPVAAEAEAPRPTAQHLPMAALDRRTITALRRGTQQVDGVIDLHGMRQSEAHAALLGFLRRSQDSGRKLVLVITGKGAAGTGDALFAERGVLRRMVPHWLRLPDLRPLVLGFEEAAPQHGGAGALYVRLRRRRTGREPS